MTEDSRLASLWALDEPPAQDPALRGWYPVRRDDGRVPGDRAFGRCVASVQQRRGRHRDRHRPRAGRQICQRRGTTRADVSWAHAMTEQSNEVAVCCDA